MRTSATWRAAARLTRRRSGLWWAVPVVLVTAALTFSFSVLTQMQLSDADFRVSQFGGADVAVSFNEAVPTTEAEFGATAALAQLAELAGSPPPCGTLTTFLQAAPDSHTHYGYREFIGECDATDWGDRLVEGHWPSRPGDVVVSRETGLTPGSVLSGTTPGQLTVTGVFVNDHATRAQRLTAAPGTWRSWDWPDTKVGFPRLSAVLAAYLTGVDVDELRDVLAAQGGEVLVTTATERGKTQLEQSPFLYLWIATPLALLATSIALGLRTRFTSTRRALLVQQGIGPLRAARIVHLASLLVIVLAGLTGLLLGWASGSASGALVTWFVGHKPSPAPPPWDPLVRIVLAEVALVCAVLIGSQYRAKRAERPSMAAAARPKHPLVRWIGALACITLAVSIVATIDAIQSFFAVVLLLVLALGLLMPEAIDMLLGIVRSRRPVVRLARARLREHSGTASLIAAAAAFTVGPVVAMMALLGSSVANDNANARMPPREGQATYTPFGDAEATGPLVTEVMDEVVGTKLTVVKLSAVRDDAGRSLTATSDGLGIVTLVDSVDDLDTVLGTPVSAHARTVLESGGVLWNTKHSGREAWIADRTSPQRIELPDAVAEDYEERWARSGAGFILTSTAQAHDLPVVPQMWVFGGLTPADTAEVGDALVARGVDGTLVRTYRAGDPFHVSPYQLGLIALLGLIGVVVIATAIRGSVASLIGQSRELIAIGMPRGWLGRVFLVECALPIGWGMAAGTLVSLVATAVGIVRVRVPVDVPIVPIAAYLVGLLVILTVMSAVALRRIRG